MQISQLLLIFVSVFILTRWYINSKYLYFIHLTRKYLYKNYNSVPIQPRPSNTLCHILVRSLIIYIIYPSAHSDFCLHKNAGFTWATDLSLSFMPNRCFTSEIVCLFFSAWTLGKEPLISQKYMFPPECFQYIPLRLLPVPAHIVHCMNRALYRT